MTNREFSTAFGGFVTFGMIAATVLTDNIWWQLLCGATGAVIGYVTARRAESSKQIDDAL